MRKTFGIEPRSFLHHSIPEVEGMSPKRSVLVRRSPCFSVNQPPYLNIPQYHILILAWCAIVVLYGETGQVPPALHNAV